MSDSEIIHYNQTQPDVLIQICNQLYKEISSALFNASAKIYHANPVWFLNDNPIVGYDVGKEKVNILFWSGQSFEESGLIAKGKHKAAGVSYGSVCDINIVMLRAWLEESKTIQWDYKHIRQNNGLLNRLIV